MPRRRLKVDIPKDPTPVITCEEIVIPPKEDITIETQTKIVDIPKGPVEYTSKDEPLYQVQVTHYSLRRRQFPDINSMVLGLITDQGIYDIYKVESGWGQLKDKSWIMLQYTRKI